MTERNRSAGPRGQGRKRVRPARGEGREALYKALVRIVARDGFDGVTFRSVAAEAGVTHGLASYHFGTRESMIQEALTWAVRHSIEAAHLAPEGRRIDDFVTELPHAVTENADEAVFQFDLLLRALRSPALRDEVRKSYDDYIATVAQSLRGFGIEGDVIARLVFATIDGLTLQQLLYDDEQRTSDALTELRRVLALLAARGDDDNSSHPNGDR